MTFKVSNNLAMTAMLMTGLHDANHLDPYNHVEMVMGEIKSGDSIWVTATKSKYDIHLRLEQGLDALLEIEYWPKDINGDREGWIHHQVTVDCNDPETWVDVMVVLQNVLDGKCAPDDDLEE